MQRRTLGNLALVAGSTLLMLWIADGLFALRPAGSTRLRQRTVAARAAGRDVDPRTSVEVVRALRRGGADAFPVMYPGDYWRDTPVFRDTIFPLAGISGVPTEMCRENGPYMVYRADEHGFTNPRGAWSMPRADIAALGDSYAQGWCFRQSETFVAKIRERYPATIVLGMGATGPLAQLAMVREYLPALRPRLVLWFYYEGNDLFDLDREKQHPILKRYLDPGFSQRLASRQVEVDAALRTFSTARERAAVLEAAESGPARKVWSVVSLSHLRAAALQIRREKPAPPACCDVPLFRRVAERMKADVAAWGGEVVLVCLPSVETAAGERPTRPLLATDSVMAALDSAGIPVLDLRPRLREFGSADDLYVQVAGAHFTDRGEQAVATLVLRYLKGRDAAFSTAVPEPARRR